MRTWIGVAICAAVASEGAAGITTFAEQAFPPGLPLGSVAYDLRVTVFGGDDWTSASIDATNIGGTVFTDPIPALKSYTPGLNDADTWITTPDPSTLGCDTCFVLAATYVKGVWFDTSDTGNGTWTIMRIVMQPGPPGWTADLKGAHTAKLSGGTLIPYSVVVPEPASTGAGLALCAAAAGAGRRR